MKQPCKPRSCWLASQWWGRDGSWCDASHCWSIVSVDNPKGKRNA